MNPIPILMFIIGLAIGMLIGIFSAAEHQQSRWERAAIEHSAGEYDAKTGEFRWKGRD